MPQFDTSTFASQLFWFVLTFLALYFVVSQFMAPRLGMVLDQRQRVVQADLDQAQRLRKQADSVVESYERSLAEARATAHALICEARETIAVQAQERTRALNLVLAERVKQGEDAIFRACEDILASAQDIAVTATVGAATKLSGVPVDVDSARTAVANAFREDIET